MTEAVPRLVELDRKTDILTDLVDAPLDLLEVDAAREAVFEVKFARDLQLHLDNRSETNDEVLYGRVVLDKAAVDLVEVQHLDAERPLDDFEGADRGEPVLGPELLPLVLRWWCNVFKESPGRSGLDTQERSSFRRIDGSDRGTAHPPAHNRGQLRKREQVSSGDRE